MGKRQTLYLISTRYLTQCCFISIFHGCENENFEMKDWDVFDQNIDLAVSYALEQK